MATFLADSEQIQLSVLSLPTQWSVAAGVKMLQETYTQRVVISETAMS
jgi:hypothetical protein